MYQVIPARLIAIAAGWVAISVVFFLDFVSLTELPAKARAAIGAINILLFVLTIKPVWRFLWRVIPKLNTYFPDLNGEYDVELQSNWPIQSRMLEAAAGRADKFDPRSPDAAQLPLMATHIRASIDLSFYWIRIRMWSHDPDHPSVVIENSRTLSTNLIRACDGQPNRIAYIYQQKNRRDRQTITDDSVFEGAAILNVEQDGNILRGEYWTNRSWQQGLSTAGLITFRKARRVNRI